VDDSKQYELRRHDNSDGIDSGSCSDDADSGAHVTLERIGLQLRLFHALHEETRIGIRINRDHFIETVLAFIDFACGSSNPLSVKDLIDFTERLATNLTTKLALFVALGADVLQQATLEGWSEKEVKKHISACSLDIQTSFKSIKASRIKRFRSASKKSSDALCTLLRFLKQQNTAVVPIRRIRSFPMVDVTPLSDTILTQLMECVQNVTVSIISQFKTIVEETAVENKLLHTRPDFFFRETPVRVNRATKRKRESSAPDDSHNTLPTPPRSRDYGAERETIETSARSRDALDEASGDGRDDEAERMTIETSARSRDALDETSGDGRRHLSRHDIDCKSEGIKVKMRPAHEAHESEEDDENEMKCLNIVRSAYENTSFEQRKSLAKRVLETLGLRVIDLTEES